MPGASRALLEGSPQLGVTAPAQTSIGDTAALAASANPARKGLIVQNTGTTIIKLTLGGTNPSQTVYHIALAAATVADNGSGATYIDDNWVGEVRVISSVAGGTFFLTEISTGSPNWDRAMDLGLESVL